MAPQQLAPGPWPLGTDPSTEAAPGSAQREDGARLQPEGSEATDRADRRGRRAFGSAQREDGAKLQPEGSEATDRADRRGGRAAWLLAAGASTSLT